MFSPNANGMGADAGERLIARTPLALRLNVCNEQVRMLQRLLVRNGSTRRMPSGVMWQRMAPWPEVERTCVAGP
jgi:hypothetical protein